MLEKFDKSYKIILIDLYRLIQKIISRSIILIHLGDLQGTQGNVGYKVLSHPRGTKPIDIPNDQTKLFAIIPMIVMDLDVGWKFAM